MAVNVVSFSFSWCSTGGPGVHSAGCWLSLLHLISNFSGPQTPSGFPRAPSAGCGFPYHTRLTPSNWNSHLTSVLTELYNSSTPTRSPTRSLEWHDWSSSNGNNCHAVHRSLSSGASVYECIMGFTMSHFISQIHPHDLFRLLAIGMCHFLPVHHFVMACLLGPKVKIQHLYFRGNEKLWWRVFCWNRCHGKWSWKELGCSDLTLYPGSPADRYYLPTPPLGQDMTQGQFLSGVVTGFEFRVFLLLD